MTHIEPDITINGFQLSSAQASTLRVAVASWLMELDEPEHMADLGDIGPLYQARLGEIQNLMFRNQ